MSEQSEVVDQLREFIKGSGKTLSQLARESGVDPPRLSRFLRCQRDLTLGAASRICTALGLELKRRKGAKR